MVAIRGTHTITEKGNKFSKMPASNSEISVHLRLECIGHLNHIAYVSSSIKRENVVSIKFADL